MHEQDDPAACYTLLARDAADQVEAYDGPVAGRTVVDVGGGSGYFTEEFRRRGAHAFLFEPDLAELGEEPPGRAVVADGYLLPLRDGVADVTFSSNVLEHVADPGTFLSELARVTRPGGLIYVSFTNWLSPWGGHEWAPWHYLGARRARARYLRRTGRPAKHTLGENLFAVHIGSTLRQVRGRGGGGRSGGGGAVVVPPLYGRFVFPPPHPPNQPKERNKNQTQHPSAPGGGHVAKGGVKRG
ncbi:class I SAM-dependent methyltransferase, partial [Streptomyces sp. NPDC055952]|uniref:class I SAM-dependent methyltransferase n=1 Tax=Streptomyces sp. NPDC055952 TaxID=3345663 RepID=UPI0035E1D70A